MVTLHMAVSKSTSVIAGCKTSALDVAFLIDSSDDVDSRTLRLYKVIVMTKPVFSGIKILIFFQNFVKRVVNAFDVSAATVRVSVSLYGNDVKVLNSLSDVTGEFLDSLIEAGEVSNRSEVGTSEQLKKDDVIDRMMAATPARGRRRVGHALSYICDKVLFMSRSQEFAFDPRRQTPKVVIILSAGRSGDVIPPDLSCFNQNSFMTHLDVTIFGVGLVEAGARSLRNKAISRVFRMPSPDTLLLLDSDVIQHVCNAAILACPRSVFDLVFLIDR